MTPARRPRVDETSAVLGLGKAGGALLASLALAGVPVSARARRLDALLAHRGFPRASLLFLAVPDGALPAIADELARARRSPALRLVVHMSGARGLDALAPLAGTACVGSFHPLASLDGRSPIPAGTLVAWDVEAGARGAARALPALARLIRCRPARIPDAERTRYHAGAVVAGNLPVALLAAGVRLLVEAGVPEGLARVSLARLLRSQAENAERRSLGEALTGPVARGDVDTITRHLALLDADEPALADVYRALSRALVDVAPHPSGKKAALRRALSSRSTPRARTSDRD